MFISIKIKRETVGGSTRVSRLVASCFVSFHLEISQETVQQIRSMSMLYIITLDFGIETRKIYINNYVSATPL